LTAAPVAVDTDDSPASRSGTSFHRLIDVALVVALTAIAVAIRRGPLGPRSLWLDDAWPALVTRVPWSRVWVVGLTSPGYSAILKAWVHIVGFSNTHAQQPAFVFGVLGPPAVYLTGRRMVLRPLPAAVAAAILLVSRNHVIYSSRVKQYTLDAFLSTLIILLAVRLLEHPDRVWRWVELVAVAVVATVASSLVLPSVSGAFLAGLFAARKQREARRVAFGAVGVYGVFAVVWWIVALRPRINPALRAYWSAFYIRRDLNLPHDLGIAFWRLAHGFSWAPTIVTLVVIVVSAIVVVWTRRDLAILLLTPIVVASVLAIVHVAPLGSGRTDLNLCPALALTVGVAVASLPLKLSFRTAAAALLLIAVAATNRAAPAYPPENMQGAVAYLSSSERPSDQILVYWAGRFPFALYARRWGLQVNRSNDTAEGFDVNVERPNLFILPDDEREKDAYAAVLARVTKNQDRVWFIASHGRFDVVTIEKDLARLGYRVTALQGDKYSAFAMLWTRRP
jgi:Dolichyl-phosphate-mannose-protein mannosyltransferase